MQLDWQALALALASAGRSIAARMAMMAITTSNSMRVKAERRWQERLRPERALSFERNAFITFCFSAARQPTISLRGT